MEASMETPLIQRVDNKIEEIKKAQATLRIEAESIARLLFPEVLPDEAKTASEEATRSDRGWFDRTAHKLHTILKYEQSTSALLSRLRKAIEPKNKLSL